MTFRDRERERLVQAERPKAIWRLRAWDEARTEAHALRTSEL
jgi:hypothetical protein